MKNNIKTIISFLFIILSALFILTPLHSGEQERPAVHALSLKTAFLNPNFSDPLVTPFHTHGLGAGLELAYNLRMPSFTLDAGLKGGGGKLYSGNPNFYDHDDFFGTVSFYINTAWRRALIEEKAYLLAGLRTEYQAELYLLSHIDSYNWNGDLSFLPFAGLEYDFPRGRLTTSLAFSLFSLVNRPPWTIYDDDLDDRMSTSPLSVLFRGDPAGINKYFRMVYDLHWEAGLSRHFLLITGGSFQYIRTTLPQEAKFLTASADLGVRYVF